MPVCLTVAAIIVMTACSAQVHSVRATPSIVHEIGIPVYPKAKPIRALDIVQSSRLGRADQLEADFASHDSLTNVESFYVAHVPAAAKRMAIPMGFATTVFFRWYDKDGEKQVAIVGLTSQKDRTDIQLSSMRYYIGQATPSASP